MDGDARRQIGPRTAADYNVHVDYAAPPATQLAPGPQREAEPNEENEPEDGAPTPRWRKILYWAIGIGVGAAIVIGGLLYWLHARNFESTDDAHVEGFISQISPQVAGRVIRLAVQDYQHVKQGELLVEIDPRDLQVKVDQAHAQRQQAAAQLEQAQAQLGVRRASVDQAEANLRGAQADLQNAEADYRRYRSVSAQAISRQQIDTATATYRSAQAKVDAAQQAVTAEKAQVSAQQAQVDAAQANLKAADVAVANAELQLSYTKVTAPRDGQIAKRTVDVGNYANPGQAMMAVVGDERWVTANFKETQIAAMQIGQHVSLEVDACPDHPLEGRVDSFQPGSGQVFSALPAENATGNFVKVVQRIPVKITIKHEDAVRCRLSPGMSVVPSVRVH